MTDLLEGQDGEERLHKAERVAARLDVGVESKVYELMAAGELRSVKIGGCRRIPESAVREFLGGLDES